jgi:hypothetical protein
MGLFVLDTANKVSLASRLSAAKGNLEVWKNHGGRGSGLDYLVTFAIGYIEDAQAMLTVLNLTPEQEAKMLELHDKINEDFLGN